MPFERRTNRKTGLLLILGFALSLLSCGNAPTAQERSAETAVVSSVAALAEELERGEPHAVIKLAPGSYNTLKLRDVRPSYQVSIVSADADNPARLTGISLRDTSNLRFANLAIRPGPKPNQVGRYGVLVMQSQNIEFDGLSFVGPGSDVNRRYVAGIMLRESSNILVQRSYFANFRHGLAMLNLNQSRIAFNEFERLQTDAIRGGGVSNTRIENNVMTNFRPAEGDHPDGIQLWSTHQKEPGRNILISENLVARGAGGPTQGVFIRDTKSKMPFEDLHIRRNLVLGSLYNGIAIDGAIGVLVEDNQVIATSDRKSWIRMQRVRDARLNRNSAQQFIFPRNEVPPQQTGNTEIAPSDTGQAERIRSWVEQTQGFADYRGPVLRRLMVEGI